MRKVDIIIKALNEEENIAAAIESSLKALKGFKGKVILVDSLSEDRTVEIAKKYNIKIIQILNKKDRSCGIGPQIGFLESKGDHLFILDGDMELNPKFIKEALKEFKSDKTLAGVGGKIVEITDDNIIFKRRKTSEGALVSRPYYCDKLMMGGLYRRESIHKIGYFSNPYLHSYEESDLGYRLLEAGFKLKRIPVEMVRHKGDKKSSFGILRNRWTSRYLWGCGELLRYNLFKPSFPKVVYELKIYLLVVAWWASFFVSLIFNEIYPTFLQLQIVVTSVFLCFFFLKKRSIREFLFSLISWNITALGLICGFFKGKRDLEGGLNFRVIKNG